MGEDAPSSDQDSERRRFRHLSADACQNIGERVRKAGGGPVKVPAQIQDLTRWIMDEFPQAQIEFDPFPSGVLWLNVWFGRRNFEMEYSPKGGTGVSENFEDT